MWVSAEEDMPPAPCADVSRDDIKQPCVSMHGVNSKTEEEHVPTKVHEDTLCLCWTKCVRCIKNLFPVDFRSEVTQLVKLAGPVVRVGFGTTQNIRPLFLVVVFLFWSEILVEIKVYLFFFYYTFFFIYFYTIYLNFFHVFCVLWKPDLICLMYVNVIHLFLDILDSTSEFLEATNVSFWYNA